MLVDPLTAAPTCTRPKSVDVGSVIVRLFTTVTWPPLFVATVVMALASVLLIVNVCAPAVVPTLTFPVMEVLELAPTVVPDGRPAY